MYKLFIVILLFSSYVAAQKPYSGVIKDFVGLNTNVGAYDDQIVARLAKVATWMREYHNWVHFEKNENVYAWDSTTPSGYGTWPFHTKFVQECVKHDINLLICTQGATTWASATGETDGPPYGSQDGTQEHHYIDKAEFIAQLVARYGSTTIDGSKLETRDKKTGLSYVKYYEDSNEPDYWWHQPTWPGNFYGRYLNAVHDAHNLTTNADYPLLGIKNVDPDAVHVMGGLARFDEDYLAGILQAAGDRLPFDIINFHHYCTRGSGTSRGICPEHETYGLKPTVEQWQAWRDTHAPGMPLWLTEFGWDTYKSASGQSSYVYAGEQSQANYLLRSLFLLMGYGIDKAFVFFDKDPNSESTQQYSSCGILTDKAHGLEAKTSYYYLATMQNRVGDYTFVKADQHAAGDPAVYSFLLRAPHSETAYCYVMWCRNPKSKYDDGTAMENYVFAKPGIQSATLVELVDQEERGRETSLAVQDGGSPPASVTIPILSETPVFLFVEFDQPLGVQQSHRVIDDFQFSAYPNPFNSDVTIRYDLKINATVRLALHDITGSLLKQAHFGEKQAGQHEYTLKNNRQLATGVYLIRLTAGQYTLTQKMCYAK